MDDFSAWPMGEISVDLFNFTLIFHGNDDSAGERITWLFYLQEVFFSGIGQLTSLRKCLNL